MYCQTCGNRLNNCVCGTKFKSFKSIAKSISELKKGEYFYTSQPSKQVFAVISKTNNQWRVTTKKCLVIEPESGDMLDTITRVERIFE